MDAIDISDTLAARSDQLNSDDLIGNDITVQITGVDKLTGEQPVAVAISGYRPWKPCKTMRRLLAHAWGADASQWVGKWVRLYRDGDVKFGGDAVGGIRVRAMSGIKSAITVSLTSTRGKKAMHRVEVLVPPSTAMDLATFKQHLGAALKNGWNREQVVTLLGCEKAEDFPADDRRTIVARLKDPPPAEESVDFDDEAEST